MVHRIRLDELRGLELFLSSIELGSISAAARRHFISQPSATAQVRNLEARLGIQLLERGTVGSSPTPAGRTVAAWARELLGAAERFEAGIDALREGVQPHVRIAASFTIAEYLLPRWLIECNQFERRLTIDLEVENSVTVADRVSTGAVELGFVESPRPFEGLTSEIVGYDELVVVVDRSHRLAIRKTALSADELVALPLLLREPGSGTREFFDEAVQRAGFPSITPHGVIGTTTALKSSLADGVACTVLSELAVAQELTAGTLVSVPVVGLDLSRMLRVIWRGEEPPASARGLLQVVRTTTAGTRSPRDHH